MRILSYCTEVAAPAVRLALGVEPLTSPPLTAHSFPRSRLAGADYIYFRLHGDGPKPGPWWGEGYDGLKPPAFGKASLVGVDLGGAVVLVANCYGASDPLVGDLYRAGAGAVITGPGPNYAMGAGVVGTDLLARWLKLWLGVAGSVQWALGLAKLRLRLTAGRRVVSALGQVVQPNRDALAFDIRDRPMEV